jgi:DNA polymerase elongation subunit (family B)
MQSFLVVDIETVPSEDLPEELKPEVALGNLKDKDKIALKVQEWEENGQIKKMSVSPFMNQIVSIQMWSSITKDYINTEGFSEVHLLVELDSAISNHDVIVGHGIYGFDLPTVMARAMINDVKLDLRFKPVKRYSNYPFYDTMQVLAGWEKDKWKCLDWWCARLGIKGKSGKASDVYKLWQEGKRKEIDDYCREDVRCSKELYLRIRDYYK